MYRKLVRHDGRHFLEVDPIRLKRKAIQLRDQIDRKIPAKDDRYGFRDITLPIIEAAIRGEIAESVDPSSATFISGNFQWDRREGNLPAKYDEDFIDAVADFSVTIKGLSLSVTEEVIIDGVSFRWLELEDEGDGPENVMWW
jgi:hypothetical protein